MTTPTRLNHDSIMLLEQPFLKVPADTLRSNLRTTHRLLEHQFSASTKASLSDLAKKAEAWENQPVDLESEEAEAREKEALKAVENMLVKLRAARKKIEDVWENPQTGTQATVARLKDRLRHLKLLCDAEQINDEGYKTFARTRLDRQLVDYLLRTNHTRSASSLIKTTPGLEALVDTPLFAEITRIETALRSQSCTEALAWCKDNASSLKKTSSTLEFSLRYQEFIELARGRKLSAAIAYCRKSLVPWQETQMPAIQRAMGLLAFDESTSCVPYAELYYKSRWEGLLSKFRKTVFELLSIPDEPVLHLALQVGLASLKLPACYASTSTAPRSAPTESVVPVWSTDPSGPVWNGHGPSGAGYPADEYLGSDDEDDSDEDMVSSSLTALPHIHVPNPDCPTCDPQGLGQLALETPFAHHLNSTIVCGMSGKVVESGDGLVVLPNGRVYSREGVEEATVWLPVGVGRIRCVKTGGRIRGGGEEGFYFVI